MSECSLSGRGQGHVSNFYIVDLENFATASRPGGRPARYHPSLHLKPVNTGNRVMGTTHVEY